MKSCTVIIVNYNTGNLLSEVVDTVTNALQVEKVIVVDNDSVDDSMAQVADSKRIVKKFRNKNYGFADSCNYGASFAKTPYLLFLNPDCLISKNTLAHLILSLEESPKVGLVGCLVCNPDGTEQRASRRRLPTFWRTIKTGLGIEKLAVFSSVFAGVNLNQQKMPRTTVQVEAISGAFILMKAKVFNLINGFDNQFPLHFEDLDLFKRVQNQGYKLLFDPNVKVTHYQGVSSQSNPKVEQLKKQGLKRYFKKHGSKLSHFIIRIIT